MTPRTRAIVLISPNNPTGAVYPASVIAGFADLCRTRGLWLILDESYRDFLPESALPPHSVFQDPDWREFVVHLYSFSKAYCVAGHRVGAMVCGPAVRAELNKVLDTMQICPPRGPLPGLTWAIDNLHAWKAGNRAIIAERARVFREGVGQLPDWRIDALGTYFAYIRIPEGSGTRWRWARRWRPNAACFRWSGRSSVLARTGICGWHSPMSAWRRSPRCRGRLMALT